MSVQEFDDFMKAFRDDEANGRLNLNQTPANGGTQEPGHDRDYDLPSDDEFLRGHGVA